MIIAQYPKRRARLDLDGGDYRLMLLAPADVSQEWQQWLADPNIMLPMGVKPRTATRQQLVNYILKCQAQHRALIGIFDSKSRRHMGLVEVNFNRAHLTATIELLVDTRQANYGVVAGKTLPVLIRNLARRFKVEKFITLLPETHSEALAYFSGSDWALEAQLAEELLSEAHGRRLNALQYAWFSDLKVV